MFAFLFSSLAARYLPSAAAAAALKLNFSGYVTISVLCPSTWIEQQLLKSIVCWSEFSLLLLIRPWVMAITTRLSVAVSIFWYTFEIYESRLSSWAIAAAGHFLGHQQVKNLVVIVVTSLALYFLLFYAEHYDQYSWARLLHSIMLFLLSMKSISGTTSSCSLKAPHLLLPSSFCLHHL